MRIILIVVWLFVGLAGVIYHFGPGQEHLEVDRVARTLKLARQNVDDENWSQAVELYDQVLADLPADKITQSREVQLEKAKSQMMAKELPKARKALENLLNEIRGDQSSDKRFVAEVQSTLANSQYYMTWLMRLEGLAEEEWMPEIEAARQHYTQLTIDAENLGDKDLLNRSKEDLESAIRLARMDLSELQGLPLPSQ